MRKNEKNKTSEHSALRCETETLMQSDRLRWIGTQMRDSGEKSQPILDWTDWISDDCNARSNAQIDKKPAHGLANARREHVA